MSHTPPLPDIHRRDAVRGHAHSILDFYDPRAVDASGGFFHFFKDDGSVYDRHTRHLVSSTRFVFLWAMASRHLPRQDHYRALAWQAVEFLHAVHRQPTNGGYAWTLDWRDGAGRVTDDTHHAYGLAFVLLAYAHALRAGIGPARAWLDETFELMNARFWQAQHGLYADEAGPDWTLRSYRGQNANMHGVEACLAAFEATRDDRFLDRAQTVATSVVQRLAARTDGLIWEHYREDWSVDWDHNRGDMSNMFRPWGYQPGHFTEWARLLVQLEVHRPLPWLLPRAEQLFRLAMRYAWDPLHEGLFYGFAPDFSVCDDHKYHWVQAETLAAAAVLGKRTGNPTYWQWYDRLWRYCWRHWVDHRHGAWFRLLTRDNVNTTDQKSPAGKVDYHTTGACWAILPTLER